MGKTSLNVLLAILAVFAPVKAAVATALVLVIADLITGVLAARKRGEPITSSGLKKTVGKLFLYEVGICLGFLTQTYLTGTALPVCNLVTALIGLTELKSCLENLDTISGGSLYASIISKIVATKALPPDA